MKEAGSASQEKMVAQTGEQEENVGDGDEAEQAAAEEEEEEDEEYEDEDDDEEPDEGEEVGSDGSENSEESDIDVRELEVSGDKAIVCVCVYAHIRAGRRVSVLAFVCVHACTCVFSKGTLCPFGALMARV